MTSEEPPRLEPAYRLDDPDGRLVLYEGRLRMEEDRGGHAALEGEGAVHFEWEPSPRFVVQFRSDAPGGIPTFFDRANAESNARFVPLDLSPAGLPVPPATPMWNHEAETRAAEGYSATAELRATGYMFGRSAKVARMKFHLINLRDYLGNESVSDETGEHLHRFTLANDEWQVTIDRWPDGGAAFERLKDRGGYAFTHVACVQRVDDAPFDAAHIEILHTTLFHLLAFGRGSIVGLALPVAEDAAGELVWTQWLSTHVERWGRGFSWCPRYSARPLDAVFPALYRQMSDDFWGEVMQRAIRVYVAANHPDPLDLAPGNAQIGLELLAWALAETDRMRLAGEADAHDRIRSLLTWCDMPTDMPQGLPDLARFAEEDELDGPEAITRVRNRVVHPPRREPSWPGTSLLHDAWKLSTWYLELVLLRLLEYEGTYANRLARGHIGTVPWAQPADTSTTEASP